MKYYAYKFQCKPVKPLTEILISELADIGFESFEENESGCMAYVSENEHDAKGVNQVIAALSQIGEIEFSVNEIADQNWNATWEKEYPMVTIGNTCVVRAPFHEINPAEYELDILINPQMSFGTGHHETTYLVLKMLLQIDVKDKDVLDMGSGTGVLAIVAKKRGARRVLAIDNEEWAYKNAIENVELNHVDIDVKNADTIPQEEGSFDVILANINKNVLFQLMPVFRKHLKAGGEIIMSGFFKTDVKDIVAAAEEYDLTFVEMEEKNGWTAAKFLKQEN